MRILVDIRHLTNPQQSGVGEYTIQLLRALFEMDQKNEYVLFSSGHIKPDLSSYFLLSTSYFHIHVPISNKLLNLRTLFLQHPPINWRVREPIDLLFLPNLNIVSLPTDIPTVLTIHDLSWHFFPEFYSKKMQWWHKATRPNELITRSRHLIVPSQSTKQDVVCAFQKQEERISVIPHGCDACFTPHREARDHGVRSRLKLPKEFALFVGTMEPRKNLLALIEGVKHYRIQSHNDLHLVLVGKWGWRSRDLRQRLKKNDVHDWVHYLGYVANEDRPALYRSATVFTWPSIYEGFGLPVLEAMASGTPVVTSHTSSLSELTKDAAILVDPYNSRDISDALRGLLGSNTLQKQLSQRGLARAKELSWKKTAVETLTVFES